MNNEEAAKSLIDWHYNGGMMNGEAFNLAIAALRTPPATGAAAMREAAAVVADGFCGDRPSRDDYTFGRYCAADEIAQAIRALPAPEVPEAVRAWAHCHDSYSSTRRTWEADTDMRDWIMKEYGL